jgi:isopentenyldiphosphate isomerase
MREELGISSHIHPKPACLFLAYLQKIHESGDSENEVCIQAHAKTAVKLGDKEQEVQIATWS